jgi:glutathione S-transferase
MLGWTMSSSGSPTTLGPKCRPNSLPLVPSQSISPARRFPTWLNHTHGYTGKLAFGQVPLYEEPGLTLTQSSAIVRHLAKKHGYHGTNAHEEALVDQNFEGVVDLLNALRAVYQASEEKKAEVKEKLAKETLPTKLGFFNKLAEKNGDNGFLVGSKLSYADVGLYFILQFLFTKADVPQAILDSFASAKKIFNGVTQRTAVKAYLERDVSKQ